jgi:hypothetical protein
MGEMTTPEVITVGAVAILVVKEAFGMVRSARQRNGHARPEPAIVRREDAPEFALMQQQMLQNDVDSKTRLERIERMVRDVHEEVLDAQVTRHHRRTGFDRDD